MIKKPALKQKIQVAEETPFDNSNNGFDSDNVQDAIEEAQNTTSGKLLDFEFSSSGTTINKWLNVGHPSTSSNDVPFVFTWTGSATGMSFANENNLSDIDLEFYVNGILQYTWQIRDYKTAWQSTNTNYFTAVQGDRISIFARDVSGGTDPRDIFGEVLITVTHINSGSGGTTSGV